MEGVGKRETFALSDDASSLGKDPHSMICGSLTPTGWLSSMDSSADESAMGNRRAEAQQDDPVPDPGDGRPDLDSEEERRLLREQVRNRRRARRAEMIAGRRRRSRSRSSTPSELTHMSSDDVDRLLGEGRPRRGTRTLRPNSRYPPEQFQLGTHVNRRAYVMECIKNIVEEDDTLQMRLNQTDNPDTYQFADAYEHPTESGQWVDSIVDEFNSIEENEVWELVDLDKNTPTIGCRWVFKKKLRPNGSVSRYKSRLVARGFTQKKGVNFNETFAPVAKFASLRLLFAMAGDRGWDIHQMDAKTAFLCSDVDQPDIFVEIPEGLEELGFLKLMKQKNGFSNKKVKGRLALRLKKALYGLRQSPRLWYKKLTDALKSMGFSRCENDHSVWTKKDVVVAIYVDDILVFGASEEVISETKSNLAKKFKMVDSGPVDFFLGLQVVRSIHGFGLTQTHYIDRLLKEFGMEDAAPVVTPLVSLLRKRNKDDERDRPADIKKYQRAIGSLMYLMLATRPDLAFAVSHLSQFCSDPMEVHWKAVKRVFRYIKGTRDDVLWFNGTAAKPKCKSPIYGFSDADWGADTNDRKSIGAYLYFYNGSVVSWASKKQAFVATSSMESEYAAASQASREGIWLREIVAEIEAGIAGSKNVVADPVLLLVDNQAAIRVAQNPEDHQRSKHIDIHYHFVRQRVALNHIKLQYIPTKEMTADYLTKPLAEKAHTRCKFYTGLKTERFAHRKRWTD